MERRRTILTVPADTHAGSEVGLMPPGPWQLEGGGTYQPNTAQQTLNKIWTEAWERVAQIRSGARLVVVHAGDAVEGIHRKNVQSWTTRLAEMERCHVECMDQALKIAGYDSGGGDRIYYVKGTPYHVGAGGVSEEKIARDLDGCIPMIEPRDEKGGRYLWDRVLLDINGVLFDIAHHGGGLSRLPWNKSGPLRSRLNQAYWRSLEAGLQIPDYWIRAHMHQAAHDVLVAGKHTINGYICPALQSKTEYGYKVATDLLATLGMLIFEITREGQVVDHSLVIELREEQIEVL